MTASLFNHRLLRGRLDVPFTVEYLAEPTEDTPLAPPSTAFLRTSVAASSEQQIELNISLIFTARVFTSNKSKSLHYFLAL